MCYVFHFVILIDISQIEKKYQNHATYSKLNNSLTVLAKSDYVKPESAFCDNKIYIWQYINLLSKLSKAYKHIKHFKISPNFPFVSMQLILD